jgi:hypothetical protein
LPKFMNDVTAEGWMHGERLTDAEQAENDDAMLRHVQTLIEQHTADGGAAWLAFSDVVELEEADLPHAIVGPTWRRTLARLALPQWQRFPVLQAIAAAIKSTEARRKLPGYCDRVLQGKDRCPLDIRGGGRPGYLVLLASRPLACVCYALCDSCAERPLSQTFDKLILPATENQTFALHAMGTAAVDGSMYWECFLNFWHHCNVKQATFDNQNIAPVQLLAEYRQQLRASDAALRAALVEQQGQSGH